MDLDRAAGMGRPSATVLVMACLFAAIAVIQTLLVIFLYHRTEDAVERVVSRRLTDAALAVAQEVEHHPAMTSASMTASLVAAVHAHRLEQALILDRDGRLLADAAGSEIGMQVSGLLVAREHLQAAVNDDRLVIDRPLGADVPTRMVYAPLHRNGQPWAVMCLELPDPLPGISTGLHPPFFVAAGVGVAIAAVLVGLLLAALSTIARTRRRLEQVHGLARAGSLAAAIAHEVKNPLSLALSSTQMLATSPQLTDHDRATLRQIEDGVRRADDELNGYLDLVRDMPLRMAAVDLAALVTTGVDLMRTKAQRHAINILLEAPEPAVVQGDRRRLHQALMNLVLNAIEAQADHGGAVRIAVTRDGGQAVVRVADDGPGIPPAMVSRLFVPFATSKSNGTGLGLSMARRVCERHGGSLVLLRAAPGAVFELRLPLAKGPVTCPS